MAGITKQERSARAMLLRYSYAHLLRRMRHKQVKESEKTMIALRLVASDLSKTKITLETHEKTWDDPDRREFNNERDRQISAGMREWLKENCDSRVHSPLSK